MEVQDRAREREGARRIRRKQTNKKEKEDEKEKEKAAAVAVVVAVVVAISYASCSCISVLSCNHKYEESYLYSNSSATDFTVRSTSSTCSSQNMSYSPGGYEGSTQRKQQRPAR